ncbi:sensor histidine kinase [Pseudoroseomonas cervicalis]|nr:histidine kinase dimerization/phosphoacceptor domain -containing protein [Pseudoroseomonas cervicalis]
MDTNAQLTLRLRQQALIAELGLAALRREGLQPLLDQAARLAAEGLSGDFSKVLEYRAEEGCFLLRAGLGWRPGCVGQARIGGDTESPAGFAFRTGRPVISNHLAEEARFRTPALMAEHGVRRAINVIIRGEAEPFGVLEVDSRDAGDFTADDINFLQALANTLGVAVDRELSQAALRALTELAEARAREAEAALADRDALLREKDLLMREIDHRVKNSLTITRSLLSLQARMTPPEAGRAALEDAARRVGSIARVHDRLYRSQRIGMVDLGEYLAGLCEELERSCGLAESGRPLALLLDSVECPADEAVTLGLIVTEVVTQAAQQGGGALAVECVGTGGALRLRVSDSGGGQPMPDLPPQQGSLGLQLIRSLSERLGGEPRWHTPPEGGPRFELAFPWPVAAAAE